MKSSELLRKIKKDGWFVVRQTGSHMIMEHPTKSGRVTFPDHGSSEMATKTVQSILKQAGLK